MHMMVFYCCLVSKNKQWAIHLDHRCKKYDMKSTMFSGPIMPRITECLAQRQEVAPEEVEEVR